mmetsp:Transcript_34064/g.34573  ORF Transcript_34064/g.34573 Transcript_34064/m.34573 type:complete len:108 (-) Transcript_34064:97-420(-)
MIDKAMYSNSDSESDTNHIVRHGHPYAQKYVYGNGWLASLEGKLIEIVGTQSPVLNVILQDAHDYYPAGPPYVANAKDSGCNFPRCLSVISQIMAEMHGYSVAAARL